MGSVITLGIGRLELEWGKNNIYSNHSKLFAKGDLNEAVYYYADNLKETKPAYVRTLRDMVRRLELLGYTLHGAKRIYDESVADVPSYYPLFETSFAEFARIMRSISITEIGLSEDEDGDFSLGELAKNILTKSEFTRVEPALKRMTIEDGTFFENLDPYVTLRLLAENPANLDEEVAWRFEDVVSNGYVELSDLEEGLSDSDRFLIVTEGSSDAAILKNALPIVAPDVADFFYFIDMSEHYPFTGAGNVVQFFKGLNSIKIQNKVVVLLDNDAAGNEAYKRIMDLPQRRNLRAATLPVMDQLRNFRCLGPSGESFEDINGKAVSIECFLDLKPIEKTPPTVRWTSYNSHLNCYQGELINKDERARRFLKRGRRTSGYDFSSLATLWDFIISRCLELDEGSNE
ncbi:MAG: HEPN/Toprim-associated domain-containing protein [Acidobacteriaceae bacterium]|jgi:hypothetical protein